MIPPGPAPLRDGYALIVSILLVLGLAAMTTGMLIVAARESAIRAIAADRVRARVRAESAVRLALASWSTRAEAALPVGAARVVAGAAGEEARIQRLDSALFLITAVARVGPPGSGRGSAAWQRAAALVTTVDSVAFVDAAAALMVDETARLAAGSVSGLDQCGALPPRAGIRAARVDLGPEAMVDGDPPVAEPSRGDARAELPLEAIADVRVSGRAGTPRPLVAGGECLDDPWNWGALEPGHPCAARTPVVRGVDRLLVRGGAGRGVLVVPGDLTLSGGFTFHGLVIARGTLRVEDAAITGAVRAARVELVAGSVAFSSCALGGAFGAAPLDRPLRPHGRWWVPAF